ncbi:hypothetical protein [Chitinimonas sp.]|uniref:hypothetical protein n=1 Tax=Chitinimonas sp. TaxID=1934313 RepID=UPI0035AE2ECB
MHRLIWLLSLLLILHSEAAEWRIRYPDSGDRRHEFFTALIEESLKADGQTVRLEAVSIPRHMRSYLALKQAKIDILWLLPSKERDQQFHRINMPLTNGLVGKRVLLIAEGDKRFESLAQLSDLQASGLVAGLGRGWRDVAIWDANQLPRYEHNGDWNDLFRLLASRRRGVDYLPRGAIEVLDEARVHPELMIEPRLLLSYPGEFYFYTHSEALAKALERALKHAQQQGLLSRLQQQIFGPALERLQLDGRHLIELKAAAE